jgi:hypothetical protein
MDFLQAPLSRKPATRRHNSLGAPSTDGGTTSSIQIVAAILGFQESSRTRLRSMPLFVLSRAKWADLVAGWLSAPVSRQRIWLAWLLCTGVLLGINCYTLTLSPVVWQDEVQILDLGRTGLPGADLTWGMQWTNAGRPVQALSFLGDMTQEQAFRHFPDGMFGARFAAQLGLVFGSSALLGWLIARGVFPVVSLLSAILWLTEPTLTQGVRGARVDALAMMFVFFACWAVASIRSLRITPAAAGRLLLAGLSLGLAGLVWPSSAIMLPLFLNELLEKTAADRCKILDWIGAAFVRLGWVGFGAVATFAIALVARPGHSVQEIADLRQGVASNASASLAHASVWIDGLRTTMVSLKASPWLIVFSFLGVIFQRRWRLLAFTGLTIVCVLATRAYFYRAIYAIPILMLASVVPVNVILTEYANRKTGASKVLFAAVFLVVSLGLSLALLGARTYIAQNERATRNPAVIDRLAESAIGRGPVRIFVGPWEFYYPGRRLDWKMYRDHSFGQPLDWGRLTDFLDCAILLPSQLSSDIDSELTKHGFAKTTIRPSLESADIGKNYDHDYVLYIRRDFHPPTLLPSGGPR